MNQFDLEGLETLRSSPYAHLFIYKQEEINEIEEEDTEDDYW